MKRRPLDPKSRWFPFAVAGLLLAGAILWPRTAFRRWRGPRLMSRKESLSEEMRRKGYMDDACAEEGGTREGRAA